MKIRHPSLIKATAFTSAWILRRWMGTLRYRARCIGENVDPSTPGVRGHYIYAFWHENMLLPAYQYARSDAHVLISQHADGELIAEVCRHLRVGTVRGSTTRGGVEALRQLMEIGRRGHLVITPDGPRGPRRKVQQGLVFLASRTGLPVVPIGVGYERPWRLRSWDRFALPRPWTLAIGVSAPPITVPANANRIVLEDYRRRVEEALLWVTDIAERWAESGRWPGTGIRDQGLEIRDRRAGGQVA